MSRKALAAAFPVTLPVLMGYLSIGIAFGLMLERIGKDYDAYAEKNGIGEIIYMK